MKNKVLINLYVPAIDEYFELYVPVNETIDKITRIIIKSVVELSSIAMNPDNKHYLLDIENGFIYGDAQIVRETNIRNNSKIVLI